MSEDICQKCLNREHTRVEHNKLARREYMRQYMHKYKEGKVAYRRWDFVPRDPINGNWS